MGHRKWSGNGFYGKWTPSKKDINEYKNKIEMVERTTNCFKNAVRHSIEDLSSELQMLVLKELNKLDSIFYWDFKYHFTTSDNKKEKFNQELKDIIFNIVNITKNDSLKNFFSEKYDSWITRHDWCENGYHDGF